MIELYLRSRIQRRLPNSYLDILDETGGVTRKGFDGSVHKMDVRCIYTTEASSECLRFGDNHCLLIDFRFVDFVLDLIAASEEEGEPQVAGMLFALYSLFVEQTLRYPDSSLQKGAVLDFLVSRISAMTHFGLKPNSEHDPGRVEYVSKLVVAHEAAHAWVAVDSDYADHVVSMFSAEIAFLESLTKSQS